MSRERLVRLNCGERIELAGQCHFIVFPMNAAVAEPADTHPRLQFFLTEMPPEMRPAMHLFGNQVMKGEGHDAPATRAMPRDFVRGLYDAGNAASIADLISSP